MADRTYLELSQDEGVSHKFYELVLDGCDVTVRYGRIGTKGTTQKKSYPTPEKAQADARKKLASKRKKGYEDAVQGVRQKRPVSRRAVASTKSTATHAPVLWRFETGNTAFGIFIDDKGCWVGNEKGRVLCVDHTGSFQREFKLPDGVKCLVADDDWLYAGCDDGNVYDLTGKLPMVAYQIASNVDIYWLDIADAVLGVSDAPGKVHVFNHEDEEQWSKKSSGNSGWMVRCDEIGVYHGHTGGVTMYDWDGGDRIWHKPTQGHVLFGWQEEDMVYAGTSSGTVHGFTKQGQAHVTAKCDRSVYSCATAEGGKYLFAADDASSVYCFDERGTRLWKLGTGCGSALSMQYHDQKVYIVTTSGVLACIDASDAAIKSAQAGKVPKTKSIKAPKPSANVASTTTALETTSDDSGGVLVECYKKSGRLRVRVVSSGYHQDWNVQFPKNLRQEGARFVVAEVRESARGGFYRVHGDIRRLR